MQRAGTQCPCVSLPVCNCVHGVCRNGPLGDGSCLCFAGYTGPHCDQGEQGYRGSLDKGSSVARMRELNWVREGWGPSLSRTSAHSPVSF